MSASPLIEVSGNELQFIRKHAPTGFIRAVSQALVSSGHNIDRVKIHQELHTIKDGYNPVIIGKAREMLKILAGVDFATSVG